MLQRKVLNEAQGSKQNYIKQYGSIYLGNRLENKIRQNKQQILVIKRVYNQAVSQERNVFEQKRKDDLHNSIFNSIDTVQFPEKLPQVPQDHGIKSILKFFAQITLTDKDLRWRIFSCLFLVFVSKAFGILQHICFKNAIDLVGIESKKNLKLAFFFALGVGLSKIISSVLRESLTPVFSVVTQIASRRIAYNTFSHVLGLDYGYHLNRHTGRLMKILDRGNWSTRILFRSFFFILIPTLVEFVFVIGILGKQFNPSISLCVLVTFVVYIFFTLKQTQKLTKQRQKVNEIENNLQSQANDVLLNYETMALFNNQEYESKRYHQGLYKFQKASLKYEIQMAFLNGGQATFLWSGLSACLALSIAMVSEGKLQPGDLVLIYGLITQLWVPLEYLGWLYREVKQALVDMEDFFNVLRTESKIVDGTQDLVLKKAAHDNGNYVTSKDTMQGLAIEFKDVEFEYDQDSKAKGQQVMDTRILKGINLCIKPGQSVALVGPSGSGKSTIIKLVTRLFDATKGSILIENQNIKDIKMKSLRQYMAAVPQDTILYNDTIANNIRYGDVEASLEQVIEVAKHAQLHDDTMNMQDGYNTIAGERGLKISGGQRQRLAIARAFLKNPNLIICDEATSALDTTTEQQIIRSLNTLASGRTAIFVAHRLSTIKDCDIICVLDSGVIQEQGSHSDLLKRKGLYYSMWQKQASSSTMIDQRQLQKQKTQIIQQRGNQNELENTQNNNDSVKVLGRQTTMQDEEELSISKEKSYVVQNMQ